MFSKLIQNDHPLEEFSHKEGDLYKVITTHGLTFELRYGYYGECDRKYEPNVIYPDFLKEPVYTDSGEPFVTMVQDACKSYKGQAKRTPDTSCAECKYFQHGEDWIGVCTCSKNRRPDGPV